MNDREKVYQLLANVPDNKIAYIIEFIQEMITKDSEMPNVETIRAIEEVKQMKKDSNRKTYDSFAELLRDI